MRRYHTLTTVFFVLLALTVATPVEGQQERKYHTMLIRPHGIQLQDSAAFVASNHAYKRVEHLLRSENVYFERTGHYTARSGELADPPKGGARDMFVTAGSTWLVVHVKPRTGEAFTVVSWRTDRALPESGAFGGEAGK